MRPCETCGHALHPGARRWHQGCVPKGFYVENLTRANRLAVEQRQRARFSGQVDLLISSRRTLTKAALLELQAQAHQQGWALGYQACERKWERRERQKA